MKNILEIFRRAIIGGISILAGAFIVLSVLYLPFYGLGSFLVPLYFWGYIVFLAPIGMIIGGYLAISDISSGVSKAKKRTSWLDYVVSIIIPLLILIAIVVWPFVLWGA